MYIAQTVPVIVGESVAAGIIVAIVTFVSKKLFKMGRQDAGLAVAGNIGENATNSPIAFGATVHQSIVYNGQNETELEKQPQIESGPTPTSVINFHDRLTPYEKINSGDHHRGIKVCWRLCYRGIKEKIKWPPDQRQTMMVSAVASDDVTSTCVFFDVDLNDFPELKIAQLGQMFWVNGTIQNVHDSGIDIECHRMHWEEVAK